jgi:predicted site-specific integrase-resolvase
MAGVKSTKSLGYNLKGWLNVELMHVTEVTDEEEVVHDLASVLQQFDGKEVSISIKMTDKLESGAE